MNVCRRPANADDPVHATCPECGHLTAVHVGTDECPVCRLVELATPQGRAREARMQGGHYPIFNEI